MKKDVHLLAYGSILAFALAAQGGCAGTPKVAGQTAQPEQSQSRTTQSPLAGKVVETMNAGGYTYISLEKDGKQAWAAVPTMLVKVGDELALQPGAEMGPFTSKTLNRTFDKIVFSGGPVVNAASQPTVQPDAGALPPSHHSMPFAAETARPASATDPSLPGLAGKVVETMNSGGYTYICVEKEGKLSWVAVPVTQVGIGEEIELLPGTEMGKFTSKKLKRTFESIVFSAGRAPKK